MYGVQKKVAAANFSNLALSMVLPHEHKPIRFPVVPATHTALLDTMSDGTVPVADTFVRKAFLCRDPSYPLWMERTVTAGAVYLNSTGSATSWNIPARAQNALIPPAWGRLDSVAGAGAKLDGATITAAELVDYAVLADVGGEATQAIFIPPGSLFNIRIYTGANGGGSGIEVEMGYQVGGEEYTSTMKAASVADGFLFTAVAGTTINPSLGAGTVPFGFTWLRAWRTTETAPTAANTPILQIGWCTSGSLPVPSGDRIVFLPFSMPQEFNNSVIPYARSRLNSSAALFTNVTAVMSKEGTILASRLKQGVVEPWSFTAAHVNSVHPSLRYFGPLEKGLYTFTTPGGNVETFSDNVLTIPSGSATNPTSRPLFNFKDIGIYNAMIFTDLGNTVNGTQLAVSCYSHIEFETTSSLFSIGVSTQPLELLHATEVALLKFGHFHENPTHWAALAAAVRGAVRYIAPMAAPYVKQAAQYVARRGVEYLNGKVKGDRTMKQKDMIDQKPRPKKGRKPKAKAKRARG